MRISDLFEGRHPFKPKNWKDAFKIAKKNGVVLIKGHHTRYAPHLTLPDEILQKLEQNQELQKIVADAGYKTWVSVLKLSDFAEAMPVILDSKEGIENILNNKKKRTDATQEKFYDWLDKAQKMAAHTTAQLRNLPQLYVPQLPKRGRLHSLASKLIDPATERLKKTRWSWNFNDKGEKSKTQDEESTAPMTEAEHKTIRAWKTRSRNGKKVKFWTSPAFRQEGKWTSTRIQYAKEQHKLNWLHHIGFLYRIRPTAKILVVDGIADAQKITEAYNFYTGTAGEESPYEAFPWKLVPLHWDAVHILTPWDDDLLAKEWSPDSTIWFNNKALELISKVAVNLGDRFTNQPHD